MLKNYFTIAWRNLLKSKWYSLINTLGLSIGMGVALMIGLWIRDELTYNHYFSNHQRLAQVMTTQTFNGHVGTGQAVSLPLREGLAGQFGGDFKVLAQTSWNFDHIVAVGEKKLTVNAMWVQPPFPDMLTLHMLA